MPRTIICSGCGRELLSNLVLCPECATPVPKEARQEARPQQEDKRPFAPPPTQEGQRPPYRWMGSEELPPQPAPKPSQPAPASPPYRPPAPQPTQNLYCPGCGRGLPQMASFCPQCGRPIQAGQQQPQQQVFQPVRPFTPLPPPVQQRTPGEQAIIAIVAIVAGIVILMFFC